MNSGLNNLCALFYHASNIFLSEKKYCARNYQLSLFKNGKSHFRYTIWFIISVKFPNSLMSWEKLEVQHTLTFKKPSFSSFSWIRKNWESQIELFKNSKITLSIRKNVEVHPKTNTKKLKVLNRWGNWENCVLSFTVKNEISKQNQWDNLLPQI